jgi:hypothetical protein
MEREDRSKIGAAKGIVGVITAVESTVRGRHLDRLTPENLGACHWPR